jgi:hypothetical protein
MAPLNVDIWKENIGSEVLLGRIWMYYNQRMWLGKKNRTKPDGQRRRLGIILLLHEIRFGFLKTCHILLTMLGDSVYALSPSSSPPLRPTIDVTFPLLVFEIGFIERMIKYKARRDNLSVVVSSVETWTSRLLIQ